MDKNNFTVTIKYNEDSTSWNNLSTQIVSFLIENEKLKHLLCSERRNKNAK